MLYDMPTWVIVSGLLIVTLVANEAGFRFGLLGRSRESELSRTVSNALKGSVFALVALLLAFSYSATSGRYDMRQHLVLEQANAVGTCYLRAGLLGEEPRMAIRETLRRYIDTRIEHFRTPSHDARSEQLQREMDRLMTELWTHVEVANRADPEAVRNSLIVPAANDVIDLTSTRSWANRNHLPDPVLVLLFGSVMISSVLLGHSSGQAASRHTGLWLASNLVFVLILYVVLDFDRPRRGVIQVDQTPLIELRASLDAAESG